MPAKNELPAEAKAYIEKLIRGLLDTPCYQVVTISQIGYKVLTKEELNLAEERLFDYFEFFSELKRRRIRINVLPGPGGPTGLPQDVIEFYRYETKKALPDDSPAKTPTKITYTIEPSWYVGGSICKTKFVFELNAFTFERALIQNRLDFMDKPIEGFEKKEVFHFVGDVFRQVFDGVLSMADRILKNPDYIMVCDGPIETLKIHYFDGTSKRIQRVDFMLPTQELAYLLVAYLPEDAFRSIFEDLEEK